MAISPSTTNISKYLVSVIRNRLNDLDKKIVPADQIIYDRLTYHQMFMLMNFAILRVDDVYPFYSGQIINDNNQPVIPVTFHLLLCDCVLSEYSNKETGFMPLEKVLQAIGMLCERLAVNNALPENDSEKMVSNIRNRLGDLGKRIIQNDSVIYDRLTHYQMLLMCNFPIVKAEFEFPLYPEKDAYPLDDNIHKVIDVILSNTQLDLWFNDTTDDDRYFVINNKDFITADDQLVLTCIVKPTVNEVITKQTLPIIPKLFHSYLCDCVLSEYSYVKPFMKLDGVFSEVKALANRMNVNNVRPKKLGRSIF